MEGLLQTSNKGIVQSFAFIVSMVHGGRDASRVMIGLLQRCFKPTSVIDHARAKQNHNIIKYQPLSLNNLIYRIHLYIKKYYRLIFI
jgi:hypothetical protein